MPTLWYASHGETIAMFLQKPINSMPIVSSEGIDGSGKSFFPSIEGEFILPDCIPLTSPVASTTIP